MVAMVALLCGVNVGGSTRLSMERLREIVTGCGYEGARTYVQSGNVVLRASERSTAGVEKKLTVALAESLPRGFDVIVRTRDQLAKVIDRNPFADLDPGPTQLHVVFFPGSSKASLSGFDTSAYAPEDARALNHEVYLYCPNGVGRSKLAADLAKLPGPEGTMRNWRTVTKLLALADEVEAGG